MVAHGTKIGDGALKRAVRSGLRCEREGAWLNLLRIFPSEQHVSNGACGSDVVCVQTDPHPALGVVGQVFGVVQPPRAVIVPEVMVRIVTDADREL